MDKFHMNDILRDYSLGLPLMVLRIDLFILVLKKTPPGKNPRGVRRLIQIEVRPG